MSSSLTEAEWAELAAEELARADDPVIRQYEASRAKVLEEEDRQRSDYIFRQSLSPIARRACAIVSRIRAHEAATVWTPSVEERMAHDRPDVTVHPGMMFSGAKDLMESTILWRIVRAMPKGCLLHAHLDAMVDFRWLIDEVLLEEPGMHITAVNGPLDSEEAREDWENGRGKLEFKWYKEERRCGLEESIWSSGYTAGEPRLLAMEAERFPDGGRRGFVEWLKRRCTLSALDAREHHHGVDAIWRKFYACFATVGAMTHYEPIFRKFLRRLMLLLWEDGIWWVETRFTWPLNYCRLHSETPETDYVHMFTVIDEEVTAFKASHPTFWGLRMIWTSLRFLPSAAILRDMDACLATKARFPHLVAGYDLVGQEDAGRPLRDLVPELLWFRAQCASEGLEIPLVLHAGETLGTGTDADLNVLDALLLGTRRIGHAFSLHKHPVLLNLVRERRVCVEACPVSNEVLRLCSSILSHPLPALLARGVPCALSNDDPAMLGHDTAGNSHDLCQALNGWQNLGLEGLGSLAENSVRFALFEDESKETWDRGVREASLGEGLRARRLKEWAIAWEKFCLWIVEEFGDEWEESEAAEKVEEKMAA